MSEFTDSYKQYLIYQYADKPNAVAEIETYSNEFEALQTFMSAFRDEFDIDTATGHRLDLIGGIVGLSRVLESQPNSLLDDDTYRNLLRFKVAKNNASAVVSSSEDRAGLNDTIINTVGGQGYVIDNQDMTLTLYVNATVPLEDIQLIIDTDLIPRPQGVGYGINRVDPEAVFGFQSTPNGAGYGVGKWASRLI